MDAQNTDLLPMHAPDIEYAEDCVRYARYLGVLIGRAARLDKDFEERKFHAARQRAKTYREQGSYYAAAEMLVRAEQYTIAQAIGNGGTIVPAVTAEWLALFRRRERDRAAAQHGDRETLRWFEHWLVTRSDVRCGNTGQQWRGFISTAYANPEATRSVWHAELNNTSVALHGALKAPAPFHSLEDAQAWCEVAILRDIMKGGQA